MSELRLQNTKYEELYCIIYMFQEAGRILFYTDEINGSDRGIYAFFMFIKCTKWRHNLGYF